MQEVKAAGLGRFFCAFNGFFHPPRAFFLIVYFACFSLNFVCCEAIGAI